MSEPSTLPNVELEVLQSPLLPTAEDELRAWLSVSVDPVQQAPDVELGIRIRLRLARKVRRIRLQDPDATDLLPTARHSAGSVDVPIGADWSGSREYQLSLQVNAGEHPRNEDLQAAAVSVVAWPAAAELAQQATAAQAVVVHWFSGPPESRSSQSTTDPGQDMLRLARAVQDGCAAYERADVEEAQRMWRVADDLARKSGAKDSQWRLSRLVADRPVRPRDLIEAGQVLLTHGPDGESLADCPDCGRIAMEYDRYCEQCGARLHEAELT